MALRLYRVLTTLPYALVAFAVLANAQRHGTITRKSCSDIGDVAVVRSVPPRMLRPYHYCLPPRPQKVATRLQDTQFNSTLGYYNGDRLWTDAVSRSPHHAAANIEFDARHFQNTIEDIYNLMSLTSVDTWKPLIYDTKIGKLGITPQSDWDIPFGGSFDDAGVGSYFDVYHRRECNKEQLQWVLLLFIRIRDFIGPEDEHFGAFEVRI